MRVTGSTIQQLEKDKPRSRCRKWRLWATTELGRKSRRFAGTWTEAQDALCAFVDELQAFLPMSDTFESYAASWHRWRVESGDYSPNTMLVERVAVNALCRTALRPMRMDEIDAQACREALLWLKKNPARGDSVKASTIAKYRQVLHAVMAQAVADGKLSVNPVDAVKAPRVRKTEREALSPDELQLLLNRLDELPLDGHVMACYLMACLALRCGEACALPSDGMDARYAHVSATVRAADNSIGRPKSEAGDRVLPVPPRLAAKVAEWRELRDGLGFRDAPTLCCNLRGGLLTPKSMADWWTSHREGLGCPGMTMHQLRHSNLSMMARHMSPFDLQRYAGWSSIAPAKVYVHADLDAVSQAVAFAWS